LAFAGYGLLASSTLLFYVVPALLVSIAIYKGTKNIRHKYVNTGTSQSSINAIEAVGEKSKFQMSPKMKSEIRCLFKAHKEDEFCHWYAKTRCGYNSITVYDNVFVCDLNDVNTTHITNGIKNS
jgi:hypothetical protein